MGTRGTRFTSEATVEIAGYEFSDEVIEGNTNASILGAKSETVVGGMGIGVAGVWTDLSFFKYDVNFFGRVDTQWGMVREYRYSDKYEFGPGLTYEWHGTKWKQAADLLGMAAPTIALNATGGATVTGATIGMTAGANLSLAGGGAGSLTFSYAGASLLFNGKGLIVSPVKTVMSDDMAAVVSSGPTVLQVNPAGIQSNAALTNFNANLINLGQPPVDFPDIATMFEQAEAEAEAQAMRIANAAAEAEETGMAGWGF